MNGRLRGTEENKKVLSLFYCSKSSLFLKVSSVWNAPPLNYFTFLFPPYLPTSPHCVAGCFLSYSSTASCSLTGSFIPLSPVRYPSFPFSSSLFSLFQIACSSQCDFREPHGPGRAWAQDLLQTKPHTPPLNWNLKVDKGPVCFCDFFLTSAATCGGALSV